MSTQTPDPRQWCDDFQIKLMAALDAAWAVAETSKDPAEVAKALARARLCGVFAATARKIAAMVPAPPRRIEPVAGGPPAVALPVSPAVPQAEIARSALERLKTGGGRRGRP
ncbi:MAG: hypothetical protein KKC14_19315 [Alphaproteobacteria bacterium]|nr:hypothetical protein [Alphaproteobacteria bacterium]